MSVWSIIDEDALGSVLSRVLEVVQKQEELTTAVAEATADRLASLTPQEKAKAKRQSKAAKQALQNPRGLNASLAQEEAAHKIALNKLLIEHKPEFGGFAKVVVEALILLTQIREIQKTRAEVKAKPKLTAKESAAVKALEEAGCPVWQLARLSKSDLTFVATFLREKIRDPHHRDPDGTAMGAFRAGHLELEVEGLTTDEEIALLLAAGRISEADVEAKQAFEAAAGRSLQLSPTLAGALARAAEQLRTTGFWPGADRTVDKAEEHLFERDLQLLVEALGGGEKAESGAWDILLPSPKAADDHSLEACESIAREMLDHLHGPEQDRWELLMAQVGNDFSLREAFVGRLEAIERNSSHAQPGAKTILMAADWRSALRRRQDEEVRSLAVLLRDQPEVRWLAEARGIDVPASMPTALPLARAAQLLRQPVDEIIWELFDAPPARRVASAAGAPPERNTTFKPRGGTLGDVDEIY